MRMTLINASNKCLIAELLKQDYRYHKLRKAFSKFYRRHHELVSKFNRILNLALMVHFLGVLLLGVLHVETKKCL